MSNRYTSDGKRKSSMTHAGRAWTCPCGRLCHGNGGKTSHQRACPTYMVHAIKVENDLIAFFSSSQYGNYAESHVAKRDVWQARLDART